MKTKSLRYSALRFAVAGGGVLVSAVVPISMAGASSLPGVVYCGIPTGWNFVAHGWKTVAYGEGPPATNYDNGPTTATVSLSTSQSTTWSLTATVSATAQVDAIFATVSDTIAASATRSWTDSTTASASVTILPYHWGIIQKIDDYEDVTGMLSYVTDTLYGCQYSQQQSASAQFPLQGSGGTNFESTGAATSPAPPWPQR